MKTHLKKNSMWVTNATFAPCKIIYKIVKDDK